MLKRLKFDNDTLRKVSHLVYYHDYRMPAKEKNVRRAMAKIGTELFSSYLIGSSGRYAGTEYVSERGEAGKYSRDHSVCMRKSQRLGNVCLLECLR